MQYGYDKNVDYQQLINQDLVKQDYRSAAIHEAQRNEKILGEGATEYQTTNNYSPWLPQNDTFQWNPESDQAMQAYRKQFLREADRQTRDTLAAYAGQTGGVPSTAAVTAAQQAGNYQRSKLTDMIPALEQNAYQRYLTEQDRFWQQEQAGYERAQEQQNAEINRALAQWQMMGYADAYVSSVLGVPVGTLTMNWRQNIGKAAPVSEGGSGGLTVTINPDGSVSAPGRRVYQAGGDNLPADYLAEMAAAGSTPGYTPGYYTGYNPTPPTGGSLSKTQIDGINRTIDTLMAQGKEAEARAVYDRYKDYLP